MNYKDEINLLIDIEDIKEVIRSPTFKGLLKKKLIKKQTIMGIYISNLFYSNRLNWD